MSDLHFIAQAYAFAARAHGGQLRSEDTGHLTMTHVCDVAERVAGAGGTQNAVAAAVLHDTVEDTNTSLKDIRTRFGTEIAEMVDALTDKPEWDDLPVAERKALQACHMVDASSETRLIKLADQTANISDLENGLNKRSIEFSRDYLEGARQIRKACNGVAPGLEKSFDELAAQLDQKLNSTARH